MSKPDLDLENRNVKFIIAGLAGMVEDDGLTPRQAFELLSEIQRNIWGALNEMSERKG
jgi:hypothetical protein